MFNIEEFLRSAPAEATICVPTRATKRMILSAILDGAKSWDDVEKRVNLTDDAETRRNVEVLLGIYVPIYGLMTEGGGCHHCSH